MKRRQWKSIRPVNGYTSKAYDMGPIGTIYGFYNFYFFRLYDLTTKLRLVKQRQWCMDVGVYK